MEEIVKKQKSPEKIREERKNYLESQMVILGLKKIEIQESEDYKKLQETHEYRIFRLERENNRVRAIDAKRYAKSIARDEKIIEKLTNELASNPLIIGIAEIDEKLKTLQTELDQLNQETHLLDQEQFSVNLDQVLKQAEMLLGYIFTEGEQLFSEYIKPRMDELGMTREGAITTIDDISIAQKIWNNDYGLEQIGSIQQRLQEIKEGKVRYQVDEKIKRISNELQNIAKNFNQQ